MRVEGLRGVTRLRTSWWLIPLSFFILCVGWALVTPIGSSPDDDYHLSSIWCTRDGAPGVCEPSDSNATRMLPTAVVDASACYRFQIGPSAGCVNQSLTGSTVTERVNQVQRLYPGGFYSALGPLIGADVDRSVMIMRIANAALASLLILGILLLTPPGIASAAMIAIATTFVPLGLFITGSTNPSSWAVNGLIASWAFGLAWLRSSRLNTRRGYALTAAFFISSALVVASRVDSNAYLVLVLLVIATLHGWRATLALRARAAFLLAIALVAVGTYVHTSSLAIAGVGLGGSGTPLGSAESGLGLLASNLVQLPVLLQGIVGGWALGWNDAAMPPVVFVTGVFVLGAVTLRGLEASSRRVAGASALAAAGLLLVPLVFLQIQRLGVGDVVQPRYLLPLLTLAVATISLGADDDVPPALRRLTALALTALLSSSAVLAHWALLHRYAAGSEQPLFALDLAIEWQPVAPIGPTLAVTSLATVVFMYSVFATAAHRSTHP